MPPREGLPNTIIAIWGKIELEQLDASDVSTVASGGSVKGLLFSFLGDLKRSARAGLPVYKLAGGAGYFWAATFNEDGRGVLRFLTIDASQIEPPSPGAVPGRPTGPPTNATRGTEPTPATPDDRAKKLSALANLRSTTALIEKSCHLFISLICARKLMKCSRNWRLPKETESSTQPSKFWWLDRPALCMISS
jgi:hypothetical protein